MTLDQKKKVIGQGFQRICHNLLKKSKRFQDALWCRDLILVMYRREHHVDTPQRPLLGRQLWHRRWILLLYSARTIISVWGEIKVTLCRMWRSQRITGTSWYQLDYRYWWINYQWTSSVAQMWAWLSDHGWQSWTPSFSRKKMRQPIVFLDQRSILCATTTCVHR